VDRGLSDATRRRGEERARDQEHFRRPNLKRPWSEECDGSRTRDRRIAAVEDSSVERAPGARLLSREEAARARMSCPSCTRPGSSATRSRAAGASLAHPHDCADDQVHERDDGNRDQESLEPSYRPSERPEHKYRDQSRHADAPTPAFFGRPSLFHTLHLTCQCQSGTTYWRVRARGRASSRRTRTPRVIPRPGRGRS
jgi:hypothetical protein